MAVVKSDINGVYVLVNGFVARPSRRETAYKEGDKVACRKIASFFTVGVGKIPGYRKYKEYWRIGVRLINIRDMFPIMPYNCDVYVDKEAFENPRRIEYPLYYQADGIFKGSNDGSHYKTINVCERGTFDEETTLYWVLKFGECVPRYYEQIRVINDGTLAHEV